MEIIKNLPIVLEFRKKIFEYKFSNHTNVNYFRGIFNNFSDAQASSPLTKPIGYDNQDSANLYKEKMKKIYSTDYPVLFWIKHYQANIQRVFDFGGHIGVHYYAFSKYLDFSTLNNWTICDVPAVLKEAKLLAKQNKADKLRFASDISECEGHDFFLASGSLQYLEWELHDKLKELRTPPVFVIINLLPLHQNTKTITLQSIGTSFCPYYLRNEADFISGLSEIGYQLIEVWSNEEKKCNIAFEKERSLDFYRGMIFQLNKNHRSSNFQ